MFCSNLYYANYLERKFGTLQSLLNSAQLQLMMKKTKMDIDMDINIIVIHVIQVYPNFAMSVFGFRFKRICICSIKKIKEEAVTVA